MDVTLLRSDGGVLCARCELADTPVARIRGLLGRRGLEENEGLLLATGAIHTSFMRFPIDVAFLDRNFVIVKTVEALGAWRVAWDRRARAVAELPAGALARLGVQVGEQVSLVRGAGAKVAPLPTNASSSGERLRVAIASADSRFLRVAGFLLARQQFQVETFRDAKSLVGNGHSADVVVIDSSTSLATAARVMREISATHPATGFVVVGEASPDGEFDAHTSRALRVLPKWESFDNLVDEIVLASGEGRAVDG